MEMENGETLRQIAIMYYLEDKTQQEIAAFYGISRSKVSRLLSQARKENIVQISITDTKNTEQFMERRFSELFHLRNVKVIPATSGEKDEVLLQVSQEAAKYFHSFIEPGDALGVAWGKTLYALSLKMPHVPVENVSVVQICGNLDNGDQLSYAGDIVNNMANALETRQVYTLPCPAVVSSPIIVNAMGYDVKLKKVMELGRHCNKLFINLNGFTAETCLKRSGYISDEEWEALARHRCAGVMCCHFYDQEGNVCYPELDQRTVSVGWQDLRNAPTVMACVAGADKAKALYPLLKAGLIHILAIDSVTAHAVLELCEAERNAVIN